MGKGSNVQKAQAARERNAKKEGKSEEERKAASAKAAKDAAANLCNVCRQTFMVNVKLELLYQHCLQKHEGTAPSSCFAQLAGYVPEAEKTAEQKATEAAAAAYAAASAPKPAAKPKPKTNDLDLLLEAGLNLGKKK